MSLPAPTARRAAARLLGVLAVLLGVLAMHGVAGTHHAGAAAPATVAGFQEASSEVRAHAVAVTHSVSHGLRLVGPAVPPCDEDCPDGLVALCVAVLVAAGAAAVLAAAARRPTGAAPSAVSRRARAPAALLRPRHGPDPVAELCVSRT